jgi:hypothetical protein
MGGQGNLYVYVGNDPVNFIDPTGEVWIVFTHPIFWGGLAGGGTNLFMTLAQGGSWTQAGRSFVFGFAAGVVTMGGGIMANAAKTTLGQFGWVGAGSVMDLVINAAGGVNGVKVPDATIPIIKYVPGDVCEDE